MREFQFFIKTKKVRKQTPDINTAIATKTDSLERLEFAKSILEKKPKYALENAYESTREIIDAILHLEGYKSYSHEASIAYLLNLNFLVSEANLVDMLRKQRNNIKYYGGDVSQEQAKESIQIAEKIINKILTLKSVFQTTTSNDS